MTAILELERNPPSLEYFVLPGSVEWREEHDISPVDSLLCTNIMIRHLPTGINQVRAMQGPGNFSSVTDILPELVEETLQKRHLSRFDTPCLPCPTKIRISPSRRTGQTAQALARHHQWPINRIEIIEDERLRERNQGKLAFKTSYGQAMTLWSQYPEYVEAYLARLRNSSDAAERLIGRHSVQDFLFPGDNLEHFGTHIGTMIDEWNFQVGDGGETLAQVRERVLPVYEESAQDEGEIILNIAHAGVMVALGEKPEYLSCVTSHQTPRGDVYLARRSGVVF